MVRPYTGRRDPQYKTEVCKGDTAFQRLLFHGSHIATVTEGELKRVENQHRKMLSEITEEHPQIGKIRETRDGYERITEALYHDIQLKVLRRDFEKGPCGVCETWGGLVKEAR